MYNKEKSGATFMSHRFLCVYKYRLNGNVDGLLLCKDRANQVFYVFIIRRVWAYIYNLNFFSIIFIRCNPESDTDVSE